MRTLKIKKLIKDPKPAIILLRGIASQSGAIGAFSLCIVAAYASVSADRFFSPDKEEPVAMLHSNVDIETELRSAAPPEQLYAPPPKSEADSQMPESTVKVEARQDKISTPDLDPAGQQLDAAAESMPAEEPEEPEQIVWNTYKIKRYDIIGKILGKITSDEEAANFLLAKNMVSYRQLQIGSNIEYRHSPDRLLQALRYKADPELLLEFNRGPSGGLHVQERKPVLTANRTSRTGEITKRNNSLFAASDSVGINDLVIHQVIEALETRVDFKRETRLGDEFALVYEEMHDEDGKFARAGKLLGFRWSGQNRSVIGLYDDATSAFYEPDGKSVQNAFLRSPVKLTRITSKFSKLRKHPILKTWRSHKGVDFAAPKGTAVRATGDGVVIERARRGGYGNVVIIKHFGKYKTLYGHLHKFRKGIKKGTSVKRGQVIGEVGSTGLATGPHVHYEFRIDNVHQDPLSAKIAVERPRLAGKKLDEFRKSSKSILNQLDKGIKLFMSSAADI